MNKKTYRGVIFDLDGTLLDTSEGVFASVRHTVEALGKPALDEATLRTFIGPPVKLSLIRLYGLDEDAANHATEIFRTQYKDHDLLKAAIRRYQRPDPRTPRTGLQDRGCHPET